MSASSKKKLRKEQVAAELTEKQQNEVKEAKKLKVVTISFVAVLAVVLCIAIIVGVTNIYKSTGNEERTTVALTIGDHVITSAELSYYYIDAINSAYNSWQSAYGDFTASYLQMMGLDTSKPLSEQPYMGDENQSWADYFVETAVTNIHGTYALYDAAIAAGRTLTDVEQKLVSDNMAYLETYATSAGYKDGESYLKASYGPGASLETFRNYYEVTTLSSTYYDEYNKSLTYTADELSAYLEGYEHEYTSYSYASYYIDADNLREGGTTDEEGNTTYSPEEEAAALAKAKEIADELAKSTSVEELDAAIADLPMNEGKEVTSDKNEDKLYSLITTNIASWLKEEGREIGDIAVIENKSTANDTNGNEVTTVFGYYVILFQGSNDNSMPLVSVRHILSSFKGGTPDETGNTVYSDAEKKAALDKITKIKNDWLAGDATEESFAALVVGNTDDSGSMTTGGLYENFKPGQMVKSFNDWCFDASRQPGDVEIVETEYGYHLIYFVDHKDITYRDSLMTEELKEEDLNEWYDSILESVTVNEIDLSVLPRDLVMTPAV